MELTTEEQVVVSRYRSLAAWGTLEIVKQGDKLFEMREITRERYKEPVVETAQVMV